MIVRHTVTIKVATIPDDGDGNYTPSASDRTATGLLFAPEGLAETTDSTSPTVIGDATLYGDTGKCDANDTVLHEAGCCDGADFAHGTWQIVGGSKGWGGGKFVLPIQQPRSA